MNKKLKKIVEKYACNLDEKKQQTTYKINYVSEYVKNWLYVMATRKEIHTLNFIDCMSNAGIYKDGDLGTSMRVLELFKATSLIHKNKQFNIFLNDADEIKIKIIKEVSQVLVQNYPNITIHTAVEDVNKYIGEVGKFEIHCSPRGAVTILFVDPYNFGSVRLKEIKAFVRKYYCELIYNVFTSDFVRNIHNDTNNKKILECIGRNVKNIKTVEQLVAFIREELTIGNMKFSFCYEFRTQTNTELYQIMYFTPKFTGIEKIKIALWEVFKGKLFHKNEREIQSECIQMSLFTEKDDENWILCERGREAKEKLLTNFANQEVSFKQINIYLQCNTMIKESQIITHVLKPLIKEGRVIKQNIVNKNNFKEDIYIIKE